MNITLTIVVAAIVILITALVVLTIFGSGMTNVGTMAQAESLCQTQCEAACRSTGQPPVTWDVPSIRDTDTGEFRACSYYTSCDIVYCENIGSSAACSESCVPRTECDERGRIVPGKCDSPNVCCGYMD